MAALRTREILVEDSACSFSCRSAMHAEYLASHAMDLHARGVARCFVLRDPLEEPHVRGYYTLSMHCIDLGTLPPEIGASVPFRKAPVALLGQLARDERCSAGVGDDLLAEALVRALEAALLVGAVGVVLHTDATWTKLVAWYEARGFTVIAPRPTTTRPNAILFMSMDMVRHNLALAAAPSE